ncbi:fumarylacetoacetate hydrolase family protein [Salipiger sp. HF18]|uniref:fumarylacetoacetate hydrolase family protein n=1 Tax=Salipiger sp. HF18 TaxID=2721557 RepID=UPI00142E6B77|nr:fumarylacetoacetate hydrolase family protein [Salipiger sp. HF18]NIY94835.1 fumarylacetoacetate hydrolase family protein [Salipiger sp. HF18]
MSELAVAAPERPELEIVGSKQSFPVRRIYCIGKNYVAHIQEMNADERDPPVIFMKPVDAVVPGGGEIPYPVFTENFHYEGELVVALKSGGYNIPEDEAYSHIFGYGVGLDMTRRDHQVGVMEKGMPWEITKAFDKSCPIGPISSVEDTGHIDHHVLKTIINGETKQEANVDLMIWKTKEIISKISEQYELKAGDIIMTGTPAGVGAVKSGDTLEVTCDGLEPLKVTIGARAA